MLILAWPLAAHAGLDVAAYEGLAIVPSPQLDRDGMPKALNEIILSPTHFAERFAGLKAGAVYRYKASFEFRAGSYSGYNRWRNELAKLAGYTPSPYTFDGKTVLRYDVTVWSGAKGPFWELISFSDAEGVIGPEVCKRVYKDFLAYQVVASKHPDEYFREFYAKWKNAFGMCAKNGAIIFQ